MKTFIIGLILTFNLISCSESDKTIKTPEKEHNFKIVSTDESVILPDNFEIVDIDRQDSHFFWLTLYNKKTHETLSCIYVSETVVTKKEFKCDIKFQEKRVN